MNTFIIEGGHKLQGAIEPQGAKNEALQVISATLLTTEKVTIKNIPDISDVNNLIDLVRSLGVKVSRESTGTISFQAKNIDTNYLSTPEYLQKSSSLRGSVMVVGPLLTRMGLAIIPKPGGDKIGRRRVDTHFTGFSKLGAQYNFNPETSTYTVTANKLKGTYMHLDEASVTGTANLIMAATLAEGDTTIYNAACEPYIQQLCKMLVKMGANISGIGSNLLHINGTGSLKGCDHSILPDMIEIGSFIGMAAITGSELTIKNVSYNNLGIIPDAFKKLGISVIHKDDDIFIPGQDSYEIESYIDGSIMTIADAIWPGLTPDLLSV
ncbi:MAG: UDP-N-acetylglucosamine 1-carboxyvinyltransferase, partial [Bacteroidales bacterium]|nr:UDP-N-acetylglucosamine 1-carboxyvinyltransferase [Bacteroidales bacterium]